MNIDNYQKPAWATFCRVLAVISFLGCCIVAGYQKPLDRPYIFPLAVGSFFHFMFVAWYIETFSDIRHYARETAIALTSGKEEKAEDTKLNESQEQ